MQENELVELLDLNKYDFMDFGCSDGQSIFFGVDKFGGKHGIGIDIDEKKVNALRHKLSKSNETDHTTVCEDINNLTKYSLKDKVRFVTCIHFLEHLYGLTFAENIIKSAVNVSEDFVFIIQPFSDKDNELLHKNLKTYYSDWSGHTNLMTSYDFYKICRNLKSNGLIDYFVIFANEEIKDSSSRYIHPLTSPINQHDYDEDIHPPKDMNIQFNGLYKDIGAFIAINKDIDFEETTRKVSGDLKSLYDSREDNLIDSKILLSDCDFVDVGCGNCGSLQYGVSTFGGHHALGIDKDHNRIVKIKKQMGDFTRGYGIHKTLEADIMDFDSRDADYYKKFRFATCINTVEFFETKDNLKLILSKLCDLSKEFVYLSDINHDYEDYFNSLGYRTYYGLKEEKLFLTSEEYINLLNKLKEESLFKDFVIVKRFPIFDTTDKRLIPINKEALKVKLDDTYILMDVLLLLKDDLDYKQILKRTKGKSQLVYSSIK